MSNPRETEDDVKKYISMSKANIDDAIANNKFNHAFWLSMAVLERLNETEKNEFIDYYNRKFDSLFDRYSYFEPRHTKN